jgi:uncharacterized protein YqjF (DUF2071 family)
VSAPWLIAMDWRDALFVHWPVAAETLRARMPPGVELDVLGGSAWIGIVAFRIARARARGVPARLALRTFGEINVRTYATAGGKPGVVFLSLDAASRATVAAGRTLLHLPYHDARADIAWDGTACAYRTERTGARAAPARFAAEAQIGAAERIAAPGSLEHRLVERYCFYTADRRGRTVRGDVLHPPWPLHDATVTIAENTLLAAANVVPDAVAPLVHASPGVATRARALLRV